MIELLAIVGAVVVGVCIRAAIECAIGNYHHRQYVKWRADMIERGELE